MTAIQFYHLTATPLERALPKLLEKALAGGFRALLVAPSDERVEQLNQLLWTYDPNSFLPHGSVKDGHVDEQPILLVSSLSAISHFSPRLRGEPEGGDPQPHYGKIGEGEFSSRKPDALDKAKELRRNSTDAENKLWYSLQKDNLGYSFRKQHPVGPYIADFACLEKHLIIEVDGGQHETQQAAHDEKRTAFLKQAGYTIVRFWNNDVLTNMDGVLETISQYLQASEAHPPSPLASGGVKYPWNLLVVTDGSIPDAPQQFERILDIFDGGSAQAVESARARWAQYKTAGHSITYLRQTDVGGWEQKAVA